MIVGLETPDDAGVYRLGPDLAMVQTVDFFTPIVDDPRAYGQIAAANALSDVYAMGARPVTALNIVGFPVSKLPKEILAEILTGGAEKVAEAGATLIGGHSIDDGEPKYGLAVTGLVHPDRVMAKAGACPGDRLLLTKPIGSGVITSAAKRDKAQPEWVEEAIRVMSHLNNQVEALEEAGVRGLTDVTGFGLLGHAHEVARESGVALEISAGAVPLLPGALELAEADAFPGGSRSNFKWLEHCVEYDGALPPHIRLLLCDAVTSGGLLIAAPADQVERLQRRLLELGALEAAEIGRVVEGKTGCIRVSA